MVVFKGLNVAQRSVLPFDIKMYLLDELENTANNALYKKSSTKPKQLLQYTAHVRLLLQGIVLVVKRRGSLSHYKDTNESIIIIMNFLIYSS